MSSSRQALAVALVSIVGVTAVGCGSVANPSGAGSAGPNGKHFFEGTVQLQGREGAPPGEPFHATLVMKGDDFRIDLVTEKGQTGSVAFDGATQRLCFQIGRMNRWFALDLNALGLFFALLPPSIRRDAIAEAQSQQRWTGRTDRVLGRTCRELEVRSKEGVRYWCYSNEEYFQGDRRLVPILQKMGYDNTFISSIGEGGLGWRGREYDANGAPKMMIDAVAIDPRPVDPAALAHICGR